MKLWLLKPVEGAAPWDPWYDKAFGFVARAETEEAARAFAQQEAGDEERHGEVWKDAALVDCTELIPVFGEPGIVLRDFAAA